MGCLVRECTRIVFETFIQGSFPLHGTAEVSVLRDGHALVQCYGNAKPF
jgi:hypothetical protein